MHNVFGGIKKLKFKYLREQAGLTQTELAQRINIPRINYNKYELETVSPTIKTLIQIADYYGVSLDYLCEHETQNKLELGYLDEQSKTLIKLIQELNDKNKTQAIAYVSGLVAGQE
ncbi:MAG: helix-turn-helix transcriptional regulator [Clostridia bacterium]|nr:helix-turn-helix transcriptional regulator [Clostridia bacterium]